MKDLRKGFENELKRKVFNYTEEPDPVLWDQIVPIISKANGKRFSGTKKVILGAILIAIFASLDIFNSTTFYEPEGTIAVHDRLKKDQQAEPSLSKELQKKGQLREQLKAALKRNETNDILASKPRAGSRKYISEFNQGQRDSGQLEKNWSIENASVETDEIGSFLAQDNNVFEIIDTVKDGNVLQQFMTVDSSTAATSVSKEVVREAKALKRREEEARFNKFNMYFTLMPTFGYQRVESNSSDNIVIESIKRVPAFSMSRLGIRAELGVELPMSKRLKIFGGLTYYQRKQSIDFVERVIDTTLVYVDPADGNIKVESTLGYRDKTFEYKVQNIGFQIGLNVVLNKKKFLQVVGTGFDFQVPLNKWKAATQGEGFSNPSAYVFYNLYYRLQYPAEGRLKAVFQPTLNYSFYLNQNLNAPFYIKPYGLGLNFGCTYNF